MSGSLTAQAQIDQLVAETGASDAHDAIRCRARALIDLYRGQFGEPTMPIDLTVLASMLGITRVDEPPLYSPDAELDPRDGQLMMRVHPDRPETRQRFSIGHEISHTFFPGYELKVQCRTDARHRDRNNPDDVIESLCDIGAAELLMPLSWFAEDARTVRTGAGLVGLAAKYCASREAVARRFAEIHESSVAAVFLSWRLKQSQNAEFNPGQATLFGTTAKEEALAARQLRIDYAIPSDAFTARNLFLPRDKSLPSEGPMEAAANGEPTEAEIDLDLGPSSGRYRVIAIPIYTLADERGPNGEGAVVAIIEPIGQQKVRKIKGRTTGPGPIVFGTVFAPSKYI